MRNTIVMTAFLALGATLTYPALAVQITDNLDVGGAIRGRIDYDPDRDIEKIGLDTLILSAKYNSETWIGEARYRWHGKAYPYQYTAKFGDISFAEDAWVGYNFDADHQIQIGLNHLPFGLGTYFGSTFFETLGNVIGLEDVAQVGIKYQQTLDDWSFKGGYYIRPAWQGRGTSNGDTYSTVVSSADSYVQDGSHNRERNTIVARVAKNFQLGGWKSEIGVSGLTSELQNSDTDDDGRRNAVAVHYSGKNGPWGLQFQVARQQMSPRNENRDNVVTFGGFDGTFNVASRGNLYVANLSYDVAGSYLENIINGVKIYGNYSAFQKSGNGYDDSERLILGSSFNVSKIWVAAEWLFGKNDPYIGGSSYTQSLATGGTNQWENQFFVNFGYYF